MTIRIYQILLMLLFASRPCAAQGIDSLPENVDQVTRNFLEKIQKKYSSVTANLDHKTNQYLERMQKQEARMMKKMHRGGGQLVTKALLKTPTPLTPRSGNS